MDFKSSGFVKFFVESLVKAMLDENVDNCTFYYPAREAREMETISALLGEMGYEVSWAWDRKQATWRIVVVEEED